MKKLTVSVLVAAMMIATLAGCSKKEEDMKYLTDFNANDYIDLGEYKGLTVNVDKVVVEDAEVEDYVQYYLETNAQNVDVTGRDVAKDGDIANIDYEGKKDGVAFDGGTSEGYDLTLGSGTFIPGFEEGVVGMKVGETKDIELTFPEDYGNEELAGAAVVFTVKLNGLKESKAPELNDEFVKKLAADTGATYTNVAEFRDSLRKELEDTYQTELDADIEQQLEDQLKASSTYKGAPSGLVDRLTSTLIDSIKETAEGYGVEPGLVASYYYGITDENYEEGLKNYVNEELAPQYIMMAAVAQKEGITISEEELNEEIQKMLDGYGATYTIDEYKEMIGDIESYREYVMISKVVDLMKENAIINEN